MHIFVAYTASLDIAHYKLGSLVVEFGAHPNAIQVSMLNDVPTIVTIASLFILRALLSPVPFILTSYILINMETSVSKDKGYSPGRIRNP